MNEISPVPPAEGDHERSAPDSEVESSESPEASFLEYLERHQATEDEAYEDNARKPAYGEHLSRAFISYTTPERFQEGVLVQWKPQLRNRRFPKYGYPAVVVEYLSEPQARDKDGDLMAEPLDIVLGLLDADGDFRVFTCASRRLTLWAD